MQVGISTASLFTKAENDEAVKIFDEWDIPVAEIFLTSFSEYDKDFGLKLQKNKGKVKINSVHALTEQFEPQLFARAEKVKRDSFYWLKRVMEVAKTVGATHYTFHGLSRLKRSSDYSDYSFYGQKTLEIMQFCQTFGVTLCFENVEWALYNQPGIFQKLKQVCPPLKGVLDTKQARISGYDYKKYIADMGENIAYVHFSDVDERGKTALPGKGLFNVEELIKRLQGVGFNGNILIENYAQDYNGIEELKESYQYLSEKIYKLCK